MIQPVESLEITVLVDNETESLSTNPGFVETEMAGAWRRGMKWLSGRCFWCAAHGLSCLITSRPPSSQHTLLFDTGPDESIFERNVIRLGVDMPPRIRRRAAATSAIRRRPPSSARRPRRACCSFHSGGPSRSETHLTPSTHTAGGVGRMPRSRRASAARSQWGGAQVAACPGRSAGVASSRAVPPGARLGGLRHAVPRRTEVTGGPEGEGPRPAVPSPQDRGPQAPSGPLVAVSRRHRLPSDGTRR